MVLMSFVDITILIIVLAIVILLSYNLFFKKEKSHCSGCAKMNGSKRKNKGLRKFYNKEKEKLSRF